MPLFYFHLRDGPDVLLDPEGRTIDAAAIAAAALGEARAIISHEARRRVVELDRRIDVEDAAGKLVYRLEFEQAVKIVRGPGREAPETGP